ncbi:MAG: carboxypeptidase-like regulatory domain-containing protein [Bryobacteraceae bacterium]
MLRACGIGLALFGWVPLIVPAQPTADGFSLHGRAVDENGRPMAGLQITISDDKWKAASDPATTDPEGLFVFNGLGEGQYILGAILHGGTVFYHELPNSDDVVTTPAGPKQEGSQVLFRVVPHAVVTGFVRDEFGDPAAHAGITLFQGGWQDGRVVFSVVQTADTDDRGQYRIHGLHPGAYAVCAAVIPNPNGANAPGAIAPQPGIVDFQAHEARYYQRSCVPARPPAFFVLESAQRVQKDVVLAAARAFSVRGRVTNIPSETGASVSLVRDDGLSVVPEPRSTGTSLARGTFEFEGVEPGRYRIEASVSTATGGTPLRWSGRQTVQVEAADAGEVEIALEPPARIDAAVHNLPSGAPADAVGIGLRSTAAASWTRWAQTAPDGSRDFESLEPGTYWLQTRTNGPLCVESVKFGGQEVLQGTVTLTAAEEARLDVAVSTQCAAIDGTVVSQGKPALLARVMLLLSGTAESPGDTFMSISGDDGKFSIVGLAAGRYLLWAWSQEELGFTGPPSLSELRNRGTTVVLTRGEHSAAIVPLFRSGVVQ